MKQLLACAEAIRLARAELEDMRSLIKTMHVHKSIDRIMICLAAIEQSKAPAVNNNPRRAE
jgi:hypothetical protein